MEALQIVATVVGIIVGLGTILTGIAIAYRWVRKWTFISHEELNRLKGVEAEHQKCEAEKERLRKLDNPMAREIQAQLDRAYKPPEVEAEFDPRFPSKNR